MLRTIATLPLLSWRLPARLPMGLRATCLMSTSADASDGWIGRDASFVPSSTGGDTVFALSSGAGRAGVSVVRVSGPRAADVFTRMAPGRNATPPAPRRAVLRKLLSPTDGDDVIDEVLALWFPAPNSFTGEDTVELHTHGSRAVVSATLEALGTLDGLRMAEPGEFTRQAFANGRMELTQVEGLADLINADTEEQRKQALWQMGGAQRERYEAWRAELLSALAHTEALIDFGEDAEDITVHVHAHVHVHVHVRVHACTSSIRTLHGAPHPFAPCMCIGEDAEDITDDALRGAVQTTSAMRREMEAQLADGGRGEVVREGVRVAILGPPNAGKSTLLNALAQRPAAIVSPRAGTTRDVVQVTLQLGGLPVLLSDTAGLREQTDDPIEVQGMLRAADEARRANVQLWVFDASEAPTRPEQLDTDAALSGLAEGSVDAADAVAQAVPPREPARPDGPDALRLLVLNKADLLAAPLPPSTLVEPEAQWQLSCQSGDGLQPFLDALAGLVASRYGSSEAEPALITRARHREHLRGCADALAAFEEYAALGDSAPLDLAAEEIRMAATELGRITGKIDVEELLDVIFRDFCIGK